jgi:hypothetical protein
MNTAKKLMAVVIMTGLVYPVVFAQSQKINELERQGFELANQLNELTSQHEQDRCSGDISTAAAYIELAARELAISKRPAALTSLAYGQSELREISKGRAYCAHLSALVAPYFKKATLIKAELEREPFPENDQPDSCIKKEMS